MAKEIITEEEIAARQAEARKSNAEGEFVILSEGKKKLTADSEALSEEIKNGKEFLESIKQEILKTKGDLLDIQNEFTKEREALAKFSSDKIIAIQDFQDFKNKLDKDKIAVQANITDETNSLVNIKDKVSKEIIDLNEEKEKLFKDIGVKKDSLMSINNEVDINTNKVSILEIDINNLINTKSSLEDDIVKLKNYNADSVTEISKKKLELEGIQILIDSKLTEVSELDKSITKKKEEYKAIESQAFVILGRTDLINQKELFIRSQFERAGVKWEE